MTFRIPTKQSVTNFAVLFYRGQKFCIYYTGKVIVVTLFIVTPAECNVMMSIHISTSFFVANLHSPNALNEIFLSPTNELVYCPLVDDVFFFFILFSSTVRSFFAIASFFHLVLSWWMRPNEFYMQNYIIELHLTRECVCVNVWLYYYPIEIILLFSQHAK